MVVRERLEQINDFKAIFIFRVVHRTDIGEHVKRSVVIVVQKPSDGGKGMRRDHRHKVFVRPLLADSEDVALEPVVESG